MKVDVSRPEKLYRYSKRRWLERSLFLGEFRLMPASYYKGLEADSARQDDELCRLRSVAPADVQITGDDGRIIVPIGDVEFTTRLLRDYLMACFSTRWDPVDGGGFGGCDACLVIHDPEEFLERMHVELDRVIPGGSSVDSPVSYGLPHPLGVAYSKPAFFADQYEHRLTVLPPDDRPLSELIIRIGSIESIAEIVPVRSNS